MLLFQGKSGFKVYRPQGQWVEPLKCRRREDTQKLIALFRGVIEKKSVVSATDGDRKVLEASAKAPPDIRFRNIMPAAQYALRDPSQIDFDLFRSNVNQHDLKAQSSCTNHHLKVVLAGERRLNRKALMSFQIFSSQTKNFPPRGDGRGRGCRTDWLSKCIRVQ